MSTAISRYPGRDCESGAPLDESFGFLLLNTYELEYEAYRPRQQEGEFLPAYAPSVMDLIREVSAVGRHAWLWQHSRQRELNERCERGPLLVETTGSPKLLRHAISTWMPIGGAIALDASVRLDELAAHLTSLVQFTLPDRSSATQKFNPDHLAAWLQALDEDHREAWLGPVIRAAWRVNLGPAHEWNQLERSATAARTRSDPDLPLSAHELARLNAGTREHFVLSLAHEVRTLPQRGVHGLGELRQWIDDLIPQLEAIYLRDNEVAAHFIRLAGEHPWLLQDVEAGAIYNNLNESPQGRLRELEALIDARTTSND